MAIVKTLNPDWFGTKKVIAAAGEVNPDKKTGEFEIAEEHVQEVLELYHPDIVLADGSTLPANSKKDENEEEEELDTDTDKDGEKIQKNEEDNLNPQQEEITGEAEGVSEVSSETNEGSSDNSELLASLEAKTLKELQDLAKAFPRKDWGALNKTELLEFLKTKLA